MSASASDVARSEHSSASASLARATVCVLYGGTSSEREVSMDSAREIQEALRSAGAAARGPARVIDCEIATDGRFVLDGEALDPATCLTRIPEGAVFFLGLHGGEGENGTLQGMLDACGFAFTGSGVAASALCMNKHAARQVFRSADLKIAPGLIVTPREWERDPEPVLAALRPLGRAGWTIKPQCGGSSVATFLVTDPAELPTAIEGVLATGDRALCEARIVGVEATCGVLGNAEGELETLPPVEIRPHEGRFFDYEEKYSESGAQELCPPQNLSPRTCEALAHAARTAHRATGCDGYSRTDFIVPSDVHGEQLDPVVLETNTLPGMTARSLMPLSAAERGMDLRALCLRILELALERRP